MRKLILLLLVLLLALPACGAMAEAATDGMQVIRCAEEGFSVQCDADFTSEYVEGDGLYIYTQAEGYIPYVLLSVDYSDARVMDGEKYISETLSEELGEYFSENGAYSMTRHGSYTIDGKAVAAMDCEYRNANGTKIYLLVAFDVYDGYTVYYRVRYVEPEDKRETLAALDQIAANLRPDPDYYSGGTTTPVPRSAASAGALSFAVTDIVQGGRVMGRCTAPADYQVSGQAVCGTTAQSISNPWFLNIMAAAPNGGHMTYASARDYFEILRWDGGPQQQDGVYDSTLHTTLLSYMDAPAFCDYWASAIAPGGQLGH